ncbi:transporter substrate-binding domain-containing protein [Colwellia sp. E2M01]|uniref:transporter substrate-binding domain-containing protein n=1 Tax=Colwellia sp. E2M01 TaxID=2841561 RepID=UPI001C08F129|nr:transporter substrate-binding domain-containing protein [Colwellia sp. E2M01]MBU2871217.1 transporter substrate-binding domain-containing protein [Colwellia sp. E2M01]
MINILKKMGTAVVLLATMVMFTSSAQAAQKDVLAEIVNSGILKVAMSGDQPPYNMKDRKKELMGLDVDLARALANAMHVELEIVEVPFGELLPTLNSGKADMIISGMAITTQRSQMATFIGPYNISGKSMLSTHTGMEKISKDGFNNPSTRIVALENSTSQMFVKEKIPQASLNTISNYDEGVKLILADKADILVADMAICKLTVLRNPGNGLTTSKEPLSIEPIGIAIPTNNPKLENLVRNYLNTYEKMGMIEALQTKWFENSSWIVALP